MDSHTMDGLQSAELNPLELCESIAMVAIDDVNVLASKMLAHKNPADATNTSVMTSSVASIPDDSTPSDSGVQLLDSISSASGMNESLMSNSGTELDSSYPAEFINNVALLKQLQESAEALALQFDEIIEQTNDKENHPNGDEIEECNATEEEMHPASDVDTNETAAQVVSECNENDEPIVTMTKSDIDNSNVETHSAVGMDAADIPDVMMTSTGSTFDTENIVYRRKVKKQRTSSTSSTGGPKKRVSFHEDILKNTKTDNIHIEHGFITYKGYSKKHPHSVSRYSWCSQGDSDDNEDEMHGNTYYRNACSDVLAYGKTDLYEQTDGLLAQYDNSGVFEYGPQLPSPQDAPLEPSTNANNNLPEVNANNQFYQCKCSSSSSSLTSADSLNSIDDQNNKKQNYPQAKSNSCDCFENNNACGGLAGQPVINDNCYFSDPSIETADDTFEVIDVKSEWRKEMKPKGSCLKKTKRTSGVIQEQDLTTKVKKFNVHQLSDMNQLIGSLKNIFSLTLPERGVPEGCEDIQSVYECVPDAEHQSPVNKPKTFLSKSFDDGLQKKRKDRPKKFVHAVDEQLRRKDESTPEEVVPVEEIKPQVTPLNQNEPAMSAYRNKYIINCESTVFEHTGVFYEKEGLTEPITVPLVSMPEPVAQSKPATTPFSQKLSNMFKSFRESTTSQPNRTQSSAKIPSKSPQRKIRQNEVQKLNSPTHKIYQVQPNPFDQPQSYDFGPSASQQSSRKASLTQNNNFNTPDMDSSMTSSIISSNSERNSLFSVGTSSSVSKTTANQDKILTELSKSLQPDPCSPNGNKSRHLASPLRRRPITSTFDRSRLSPDLFSGGHHVPVNAIDLISQEFDDLLTVTTDAELNENDIEILDYPSAAELAQQKEVIPDVSNNCLRPPSSKTSLINRFLRNVTQKKIQDATVKKNNILCAKYRQQPKNIGNLYVKTAKPIDQHLIADMNAEIAHEIEMNVAKEVEETVKTIPDAVDLKLEYGTGVGEVCVDIFNGNTLHILKDDKEILMKVFKLYTGYSLEGHMTPVLVFLTDKTLYVTDLVRNRLCNKFVLPYTELDIILIGPHGNTVLLSNGARDMQQVLLAGGPYPTDGLVSSLELCARRGGTKLPAIGQLTLDHLAPLQAFVRENSPVSRNDAWVYYAVVSLPANLLSHDEEPLGPNIKGFLMHRTLSFSVDQSQQWLPGYFLLKAGVLYMFSDSNQKIPTTTITLSECKGARRAVNSQRPHCFELILKTGFLQLAAPDEYVASDWLQTLVQSASGLFEMQEKHKTLGCTIVITSNHIITLRENFEAPLRRMNISGKEATQCGTLPEMENKKMSISSNVSESFNETCSNVSTRTSISDRFSSTKSSPHRSQALVAVQPEKSFSSISSIYGKNSGVEVKTCAALEEIVSIRISSQSDHWWCILEFSCQEVQENPDDLIVFFATNSDMRRFLTMLESLWQTKKDIPFPIIILAEDDNIAQHCGELFDDLNRSWEPLITVALGYPQ